jgi:hypothetical protein
MESRDEAAPSHRTWKTPMKLAFPTAPTAPAARKEIEDERPNQKNRHRLAICPYPVSSVSLALPQRGPLLPAILSRSRYFESGEGCTHEGDHKQGGVRKTPAAGVHAADLLSALASRIQSRSRFELTTVRSTNNRNYFTENPVHEELTRVDLVAIHVPIGAGGQNAPGTRTSQSEEDSRWPASIIE